MHIGETEIAALKAVDELLVIETKQVQDSGLEIVDMDFVAGNRKTEFVGLAIIEAPLDSATCQKH